MTTMGRRPRAETPPDFGDELFKLRAQRGMSQTQLATRAGLDHSHISRLETGARLPLRATVLDLAIGLACTPVERDRLLVAAGMLPSCERLLFVIRHYVGLEAA